MFDERKWQGKKKVIAGLAVSLPFRPILPWRPLLPRGPMSPKKKNTPLRWWNKKHKFWRKRQASVEILRYKTQEKSCINKSYKYSWRLEFIKSNMNTMRTYIKSLSHTHAPPSHTHTPCHKHTHRVTNTHTHTHLVHQSGRCCQGDPVFPTNLCRHHNQYHSFVSY